MNTQSVYDSENLDRVRSRVEILVELYMKKLGPDSDTLKPRQHVALDCKISRLTKQVLAMEYPVWREFEFRLFVIAYRAGKLPPELWSKLRHMHPLGDPYKTALATLFQDVMGRPIKRVLARLHGWPLHGDELASELPLLRKMFDNPAWKQPLDIREQYMNRVDGLSLERKVLHLMAWLGVIAVQVEEQKAQWKEVSHQLNS